MADEEEGASMSDDEMSVHTEMSVEEESSGDESDGEELYEVEEIVGMKKNSEGVKLYKVRWQGYSKIFDTWEPVENLESCLDMVEEYEDEKDKEKKKRSDERKKRMALMAGRQMSSDDEGSESGSQTAPSIPDPEPVPPSPASCSSSPQVACTLKDTFWKDLEEGRINLFNTDMYSKVKGQGRASRPRSFKRHFSDRETGERGSGEIEKGQDDGTDTGKSSRGKPRGKVLAKQTKEASKRKGKKTVGSKGGSGKGRPRPKELSVKDGSDVSSVASSDISESSSDSSDIIMAQVISVSTPSPPVLSCVEDYSDDSSRDFSDNRYSSPADITGSLSQSPNHSQGAMSEDTGIGLDLTLTETNSPKKVVRNIQSQIMEKCSVILTPTEEISSKIYSDCKSESPSKSEIIETEKTTKVEEVSKANTAVKKLVVSESKSAKKTKHQSETSEVHRIAEKKVKLDSEFTKQKPRHKSSSSHKDIVSNVPSKPAVPVCAKTGKENIGDKQVMNIFTGLSSVLTPGPVSKQRSPVVHTVSRSESRMETNVGQTNTGSFIKRKDPATPGDRAQSLEKILSSSSLLPILPDNKTATDKGVDLSFDIDLEDIDLDKLEKQLTLSPSAQPLELSDEELKQAVFDGDYDLVKRAFAAHKLYDVEQGDDQGTTLLMQAVLRNFDDIAEVLVCSGAKINAQQKNGNTSLMIAAEQAHICTVALLIEMGAKVNMEQLSGETALMKAVKRGHKQIIRYLLESGANFSYLTYTGYSALSYAKLLRLPEVEDIIIDHISRLTGEFDRQVAVTLNNTAQIISALFPLQCFPLSESEKFVITFKNEMEPITPGVGFLLFIAHARVTSQEIKCRFYGPCAVTSVVLNGVKQPSLTEEANFVLSCHPVLPGKNELCIHTESAVSSKAKLVVCAYKAQLIQ